MSKSKNDKIIEPFIVYQNTESETLEKVIYNKQVKIYAINLGMLIYKTLFCEDVLYLVNMLRRMKK